MVFVFCMFANKTASVKPFVGDLPKQPQATEMSLAASHETLTRAIVMPLAGMFAHLTEWIPMIAPQGPL